MDGSRREDPKKEAKRLVFLGIHSRCEDSTKVVVCSSWTVTSDVIDDVFGSLALNDMYFL